jgi:NDP-sugar pyrophosphorylase family protein
MAIKGSNEGEPENITICQQPHMIATSNPEEEVWHHINKLTSFEYVSRLLKERLDNNFFGFGEHISALTKAKLIYNTEHPSNESDDIETHQMLADNGDIRHNAKVIHSHTKHYYGLTIGQSAMPPK